MSAARVFPIYDSKGEVVAVFVYPNLFNLMGDWIGWVTSDRQVYALSGRYAGWLSEDWRILRKRSETYDMPHRQVPEPPPRLRIPAHFPLAPMLPNLPFHIIDVMEEDPDILSPLDLGQRFTSWD